MENIDSLYLAIKIIKKRLILNIVLGLQLLLCIAFLFTLISDIQFNSLTKKIVLNKMDLDNAYYIYLFDQFLKTSEDDTRTDEVFNKLHTISEVVDIGEIKRLYCELENDNYNNNLQCYTYNKVLIDNMKCLLDKGNWFTEVQKNDNVIPIVITKDVGFKLEDKIQFSIPNGSNHELQIYNGIVIGILNDMNYMYDFGKGGSDMELETLMNKNSNTIIIPEYCIDKECFNNSTDSSIGKMVFVDNRSVNIEKKLKDLSIGSVADIEEMKINSKKKYDKFLLVNILALVVFTFITIAGIGGNNCFQRVTNEKNFSVYYMMGMSWGQCILIEIWRTILSIGIPYIVFLFLYITNNLGRFLQENSVVNFNTFLFIFIYITLLYIVTSIGSIVSIAKSNPVEIIRRWE